MSIDQKKIKVPKNKKNLNKRVLTYFQIVECMIILPKFNEK